MHNCECEFYRIAKGREEQLKIPKCHYIEDIDFAKGQLGLLIMEDVGSMGGHVKHLYETLSVNVAKEVEQRDG